MKGLICYRNFLLTGSREVNWTGNFFFRNQGETSFHYNIYKILLWLFFKVGPFFSKKQFIDIILSIIIIAWTDALDLMMTLISNYWKRNLMVTCWQNTVLRINQILLRIEKLIWVFQQFFDLNSNLLNSLSQYLALFRCFGYWSWPPEIRWLLFERWWSVGEKLEKWKHRLFRFHSKSLYRRLDSR